LAPQDFMGIQTLPRQDVGEYSGFDTVSAHTASSLRYVSIVYARVSQGESAESSAKAMPELRWGATPRLSID
jgi:hypothetical protein